MLLPLGFLEFFGLQGFLMLAIIGLLIYGEQLPEVAAKFAKQFGQLKKSVQGIRNELESVAFDVKHSVAGTLDKVDDLPREEATAPKFEPPPAEPYLGEPFHPERLSGETPAEPPAGPAAPDTEKA
jgi:sec-independent protein translocase protein TatA